MDSERVRTFSWSDPLATARAASGLPGIDAIRAIATGELPPPPIAMLLDFEITLLLLVMLATSYAVAAVLLAAIGFVTVMSFSFSVVMGQEYLPSRLGIASGVTLGFAIGVGGVAAALLGLLADAAGLETVMWTVALLPIAGLGLALLLPLSAQDQRITRDVRPVDSVA